MQTLLNFYEVPGANTVTHNMKYAYIFSHLFKISLLFLKLKQKTYF